VEWTAKNIGRAKAQAAVKLKQKMSDAENLFRRQEESIL
jgi:hypothetical protein